MSMTDDLGINSLQLVQETALDTGDTDLIFTKEQFERLDQHLKRRIAGAASTDEITGKSTLLEVKSYAVRQYSLDEFSDDA